MRSKISYRERHRVKIYLNNFVDKDVQSMFLPLNLMQMISFCPKYRIKNNLITTNNPLSKFIALCGTTLYISIFFCNLYYSYSIYSSVNYNNLKVAAKMANFCLFTLWFINNCIRSVFRAKENVLFILTFQNIHRFLNSENKFKLFVIGNWVIVAIFVIISMSSLIYVTALDLMPAFVIWGYFAFMIIDVHLICATRLIQLLKDKVDLWSVQALNYQITGDRDEKIHCEKLFDAYINILDCYDIYKISSQQLVSTLRIYLSLCMHTRRLFPKTSLISGRFSNYPVVLQLSR